MVFAVLVTLPAWYIAAWFAVSRAAGIGIISVGIADSLRPAFSPIIRYCDTGRPGASRLSELWWTLNPLHRGYAQGGQTLRPTNAHIFMPNDLMDVQSRAAIPDPSTIGAPIKRSAPQSRTSAWPSPRSPAQ
jgi:hypothetical protein